jgi:cephalosporin-C deacetylase-like acetyl esterase
VHDHRNFGATEGTVRHEIDPWHRIADWRRAISVLESSPELDAARTGVWGTRYAGGHVLVPGATDRRIREGPRADDAGNDRRRLFAVRSSLSPSNEAKGCPT